MRVWTWPGNTAVLPELRDGSADAAEALARPGRYTIVDDHLKVKEVLLESTPGVRRVVCWNTAEAAKDKARRDDAITRAGDRVGRARRAECALREHRTLGRYHANSQPAGFSSTTPRSQPRPRSTASTCCPPPTST